MFFQSYYVIFLLISYVRSYTVEVKVNNGLIKGTREESIFGGRIFNVFYGVPYARPPVGKLRFKDPKPQRKWKNPYDATTDYHGICAQAHIVHKYGLHGFEDCLYMNIYTPSLPKGINTDLKPVLIFIHGYAFTSSLSHIYGADFLIDRDIIFISVTHRIGVFGFLKLNDNDPHVNMGIKDIIMAIKWIRKNIKFFGGDRNKITVMGSDSGASFLSLLLTTKYRKLYSKMILQSGSIFSPSMFQSNHKMERERLIQNLRRKGWKDIMSAPTKDIIFASQKIYSTKEMINFQKPVVPFTPILENESNNSLLIYSPDQFYKAKNASIPMLIGFNSRESISEIIPFIHNTQYLNYFSSHFKFMVPFSDGCMYNYTSNTYEKVASSIKTFYFNHVINEKSLDNFIRYTTDLKIYPIWKFIKMHQVMNSEIFVYKFNYVGLFNAVKATSIANANVKITGASNGDELCYILRCEPLMENYAKIRTNMKSRDRSFINDLTALWANFVKTGNPSPPSPKSNVNWQPFTSKHSNMLLIDKVSTSIASKTEDEMYAFWNNMYDTIYSKVHCGKTLRDEL